MKNKIITLLLILLLPAVVFGDVQIKSGATTDTLTVNTNKAALTTPGVSTRKTYIAATSAHATTAANMISIESASGVGFKLVKFCVSSSVATAGAAVTVTVQRRTTASSAGTALTNEGTGATTITAMDPADANYSGVARLDGTPGTGGAVIDQFSFMVAEVGTVDSPSPPVFCKSYGELGDKMPIVSSGTSNGLSINVSAAGSGGLAGGSITATIIQE